MQQEEGAFIEQHNCLNELSWRRDKAPPDDMSERMDKASTLTRGQTHLQFGTKCATNVTEKMESEERSPTHFPCGTLLPEMGFYARLDHNHLRLRWSRRKAHKMVNI